MFNIFRSAPPLATQLGTMISFANCTTPAQVADVWPSVQQQVFVPSNIAMEWASTRPMQDRDPQAVDSFRNLVVSRVRPDLDARVLKVFRPTPSERKLRGAGFAGHEGVIDLAKSAFDSRVISAASSAYMLEAAMRMQGENWGNSELPVGLKIAEAAVITGVACYAEYMIYDVAEYAIAKYSMMSLLGAATVYYIINRVSDIIKNR